MEKRPKRHLSEDLALIVGDALKKRLFSACSLGCFRLEKEGSFRVVHHYGYTDSTERGAGVKDATLYDLASLTKPLATVLAVMALVEKGKVRLKNQIGEIFPVVRSEIGKISLAMLLSHSSGLPAHRPYFEILAGYQPYERKEAILQLICRENLQFQPGGGTLYSDLGFIILGCMVEKITGQSLAAFWEYEIARPMGLQAELFFPGTEGLGSDVCAVTGVCRWSNRRLCGIVHDDNCRMLGGVAGHAGLFGTASGVLSLAENLLLQYRGILRHPAYSEEIVRKFLTKRQGSTWTYGFDTPSPGISSSGRFFSERTVGHLGFTGTSFWIDLERGWAVVLLTNRVLMGDDPAAIRKFRPLVHDIIMKHMMENKKPD